jgi:hypothetical protein
MVYMIKMEEKTTVKMDKELVKRAHELGFNVSKVCENALKKVIGALEGTSDGSSSREKRGNTSPEPSNLKRRARRDLNPSRKLRRLVSSLGFQLSRLDYGPVYQYRYRGLISSPRSFYKSSVNVC